MVRAGETVEEWIIEGNTSRRKTIADNANEPQTFAEYDLDCYTYGVITDSNYNTNTNAMEYTYTPGQYYHFPGCSVKNLVVACDGSRLPPRDFNNRKKQPLLVDTSVKDLFTKQKRYKKQIGDIKKTYVGVGSNGYIVQKKRYDLYGNDIWEKRKFTQGVKMEDCSVDLIYYTNAGLPYSRIVYINPKNIALVKKYLPNLIKTTDTISDWFLECKYNPKYKYCRDRLEKEYEDIMEEGRTVGVF